MMRYFLLLLLQVTILHSGQNIGLRISPRMKAQATRYPIIASDIEENNGEIDFNNIDLEDLDLDINSRDNTGNTLLFNAVANSDIDKVNYLLSQGANPNVSNLTNDGMFPLHKAVRTNNPEIISLLLKAGANMYAEQNEFITPLNFAITCDYEKIDPLNTIPLTLLLKHGADLNRQNSQGKSSLDYLFSTGPDDKETNPSTINAVLRVINSSNDDINNLDRDGKTTLFIAVEENSTNIVKDLLALGANPNLKNFKTSMFPLSQAVINNNIRILQMLLDNEADINAQDNDGNTALHYAVSLGHANIVKKLLSVKTIQLNLKNSFDYTPLYMAVLRHNQEITSLLLKAGADMYAENLNNNNDTPFICAVEECIQTNNPIYSILVNLFLQYGADSQRVNSMGISPLMIARLAPPNNPIRLLLLSSLSASAS